MYWNVKGPHPPYYVYKLIAEMVHGCIHKKYIHNNAANAGLDSKEAPIISRPDHYNSLHVCEQTLSSYKAYVGAHYDGVKETNWPLQEDRVRSFKLV